MKTPYLEITQHMHDGWQAIFAFQIFHRPADEWLAMRWGFNAGALLDEALDRYKLFIESQALNEATILEKGEIADRTLVLRGMNLPGEGLQITLLGRVNAAEKALAQQTASDYAREIFSIFPHDFLIQPAETKPEYDRLYGKDFFARNPQAACIQRGMALIPSVHKHQYFSGLWQSSARASEQVWRALSNMSQAAMLNITLQPSIMYRGEKELLLDAKEKIALPKRENPELDSQKPDEVIYAPYIAWADDYIKRRLASWKKFFLLQIHILVDGRVDENLLRSIGSAITRDINEALMPGFKTVRPNSIDDEKEWIQKIRSLDFIPTSTHMDDLADLDEVFAVFRIPYRLESDLPGTNFIPAEKEPSDSKGQ